MALPVIQKNDVLLNQISFSFNYFMTKLRKRITEPIADYRFQFRAGWTGSLKQIRFHYDRVNIIVRYPSREFDVGSDCEAEKSKWRFPQIAILSPRYN